jgi:hypothetical protein
MLEGVRIAQDRGFKVGLVTNAYWATSFEDAKLWLKPLANLGISDLSVSDDLLHFDEKEENLAKNALLTAKKMGLPVNSIGIDKPDVQKSVDKNQSKGEMVVGGGVMFRGRAVEKLAQGLSKRGWEEFTECPYEDLKEPKRVHLDPFGNVHLCQGLNMGRMEEIPLSILVKNYNAESHPICASLLKGGPALLAKQYNVKHEDKYVDACHFCYLVRKALIDRFPQYLAPKQVYGL